MIGNVFGNYKVAAKIGEGGMGAVYKAVDLMLERDVAIKVLKPELADQPDVVERFRAEAVTLAKLNHPKIATLYSFFRDSGLYLMVMEFVPGQTLADLIAARGALDCGRAVQLFSQALEGIDYAHSLGVIHRDIKPANVMMTPAGVVKVMDFGIARVLGSARMTRAGHLIGTIEYMPPEQVRGQHTDARSDIYSSGIVLYEMLTGRVPFMNDSEYNLMRAQIEEPPPPPREFSADIPEAIERAILRALAKKPEDRFSTAGEFRTALLEAAPNAAPSVVVPYVPPTRVEIAHASSPSPQAGANVSVASGGAQAFGTGDREIKATRVSGGGLAFNDTRPARSTEESAPRASLSDSFATRHTHGGGILSRLDWRFYVAACVALSVAVLATAFVMSRSNGTAEEPAPPQTGRQQAQSTPTPMPATPTPPVETKTETAGPAQQPAPQSPPAGIELPAPDNGNSSGGGQGGGQARAKRSPRPREDESEAVRRKRREEALNLIHH
ncbi:MAG: eukaryotic-like serine/threonine-protein kinase [Acidobacteriota bacterium]|nr:eukaryotic-like serine/threonine-protein kinase [Acidobacteriota bacterium]